MWGHFLGPLLAGYFVVCYGPRFKHYHSYLDQQRVLFHSAAVGVVAFAVVELAIVATSIKSGQSDAWITALGMPAFTLASLVSSVLLLLYLGVSLIKHRIRRRRRNLKIDPELESAIRTIGLELDVFLLDAYLKEHSILVTLDNGKFYVAQVNSTPTPRETKYIQLLPLLSGYRDAKHELVFTSNYVTLFETYPSELFRIVIELQDITTFATWDAAIYDKQFRSSEVSS